MSHWMDHSDGVPVGLSSLFFIIRYTSITCCPLFKSGKGARRACLVEVLLETIPPFFRT